MTFMVVFPPLTVIFPDCGPFLVGVKVTVKVWGCPEPITPCDGLTEKDGDEELAVTSKIPPLLLVTVNVLVAPGLALPKPSVLGATLNAGAASAGVAARAATTRRVRAAIAALI